MSKHVAVWVDHKEARIFAVGAGQMDETTTMAQLHNIHHKHPTGPEGLKEHPDDAKRFFHEIGKSLLEAEEILIAGPGTAKLEFLRYLHKHEHALEPRIVGVETVDHPTDKQFVAYAKRYFTRVDRML